MKMLCAVLLLLGCSAAHADFSHNPKVPELLAQLRSQAHFTSAQLRQVRRALVQAKLIPKLIKDDQNAKEHTLTWAEYEPIHVNPANISNGLAFLTKQKRWLKKAHARYGVPPVVITALLGVETKYGAYTGRVRVLDALATMGFDHPTRSTFFFNELEKYFVLCRENKLDPAAPLGSYAGAMGDAQFMPSSYLRLGVDFDGNGRVNLWSAADAIGSVANYLANFRPKVGWKGDTPLIVRAHIDGPLPATVQVNAKHANTTVKALESSGIKPAGALSGNLHVGLIQLDGQQDPEYWIALHNFYSVMSYNPRIFYAMAVARLASKLRAAQHDAEVSAR